MAHGWVPTPETLFALAYDGGQSQQPPLAFIDDHLAYIAGRVLVFQSVSNNVSHLNHKSQSFLTPKTSAYSTLAFCLSSDNQLLVTAEAGPKSHVVVYEALPETSSGKPSFKRKKVISQIELTSKDEALALDLSFDTKYLALLLPEHQPQGMLLLYLWRTSKIVASVQLPPAGNFSSKAQVLFHPADVNSLTVLWSGQLKIWRLTPDGFEQGPKLKYGHPITCQAWLSSLKQHHLILGTEDGHVLSVQEGDVTGEIKINAGPILALCCFGSTKFICAFLQEEGILNVSLFGSTDAKNTAFTMLTSWPISLHDAAIDREHQNMVTSVVTNTNATYLAICAMGKLAILDLANKLPMALPMAGLGKEIRCLDFTAWKPQFLTLSGDKCWTLWDYTHPRIQMQFNGNEDILTCSIHPSGHYLLYSTKEALIIAALLVDKFHTVKEIRQRSDYVVCNPGGHVVAFAHQNKISLFHYARLSVAALPCTLRTEVKCLAWVPDGSVLFAAFSDGSLLQFDPYKASLLLQRKLDVVPTLMVFASSQNLLVLDEKGSLYQLDVVNAQVMHEITVPDVSILGIECLFEDDEKTTCNAVLAATSTGAIRVYTYPFTTRYEYHEYFIQSSSITKMGVSYDRTTLISCGADGSICVWRMGTSGKSLAFVEHPKESLVLRDDWFQHLQEINQLKYSLDEAQYGFEFRLKSVKKDLHEQFLSEEVRQNQLIVRLTKQTQDLEEKLKAKDSECQKRLEEKKLTLKREIKLITDNFETKLANSFRGNLNLERRSEELIKLHEEELKALRTNLEASFNEKLAKLRTDHDVATNRLTGEKQDLLQRVEKLQTTLEDQRKTAEIETKALQKKYDRFLSVEKQVNLKLRSEAGVMRKSIASLQRDLENQKQNAAGQQVENQRLSTVISDYQRNNTELKEDLAKRDTLVKSKDDKLRHLSRLLEQEQTWRIKHESELDDVTQAKRVGEIFLTDLRATLEEKEKFVKRLEGENVELQRSCKDLQGKVQAQKESNRTKTLQIQTLQKSVENWKHDLDVGLAYVHDYAALKPYFLALHELYCKDINPSTSLSNQEIDWPRKYALLEHSFLSLKHTLSEERKTHATIKQKLMQDNAILLKELEKRSLHSK